MTFLRFHWQLQAHIVKLGFQHDEHVQNSIISFYGKYGEPAMARLAFDRTEPEERTKASWSALLAAYTRAGLWGECLESFGAMVREGWRPDESSMVSALSVCAHLGAYDVGRSIHCSLRRGRVPDPRRPGPRRARPAGAEAPRRRQRRLPSPCCPRRAVPLLSF